MPVQQLHTASVTGAEQTGGVPETVYCSAQTDAGCVTRQQCAPRSRTAHTRGRADETWLPPQSCEEERTHPQLPT